ncbi:carbohydrate kinase family protein [Deinococcus misasensis]|uniref:carbohydrate kinase family protein n=1 Tax=Deinococcus misasensis TaxID=392413 RepID=UPI00068CE7A6|nr:carbohydrate kinase family protein [Deinococcus misasensis]
MTDFDPSAPVQSETAKNVLISFGDLTWDVLAKPDSMLLPGGDTTGVMKLMGGGSAANVAAWAARVGCPTTFVGKVGKDRFGEMAQQELSSEGVQTELIWCDTQPTGVILALIDQNGQRSMLSGQGADFYLYPSELPTQILTSGRHLHVTAWSLFTDPPRAAALRAAALCERAGMTISLDPGSFQMISQMGRADFIDLMHDIEFDILLPNRDEAHALSGKRDPQAMLKWFRHEFPNAMVVLKLDREGVMIDTPQGERIMISATSDTVIDATGAGDSFGGAFLGMYLQTGDLRLSAQCAVQAAGWVISRYGARAPIDHDLRQRLERYRAMV